MIPLVLLGALAFASGCANEDYYCDDTGCYSCDGIGCRAVEPPDRPSCRGDFECAEGSICTDTGCVEEGCASDADCPTGTVCRDAGDGSTLCVAPTEPLPIPTPGTCTTNADCDGADLICLDGVCTSREEPSECTDETECASGQECVEDECRDLADTCQFNTECGPGRLCVDQRCTTACGADNPCAEGLTCDEGFCVEPPPPTDECSANADCGAGQICLSGACYDECSGDAACGDGEYCYYGRCRVDDRPNPFCVTDADCMSGSVCRNGACRSPCEEAAECQAADVSLTFCLDMLCATTNEATSDCSQASDCMSDQRCVDGVCR